MSREELVFEVRDDEIIVTLPGTGFSVTYFKPADLPQLIAKKFPRENEKGAALTHSEFLAQAWKLANDKARELGWIVYSRAVRGFAQYVTHQGSAPWTASAATFGLWPGGGMMTDQTHSADAWLLKLFDRLKIHARAEAGAPTEEARERSHDSVRVIEIAIRDTPAESLIGVAIKLAVWRHINRDEGAAAAQVESAYQDLCRIGNRDYSNELDEAAALRGVV